MIVELADGREFRLPDDSEETKVDELVKALLRAESTAAAALATAQALQAEIASLRKQVEARPGNDGAVEFVRLVSEVFIELLPADLAGEAVAFIDIKTFLDTTARGSDFRVYLVNVIGDVHVVGDGVLVAVFHDEVLIKEADRLFRRRGGKADEIGIEVFEHLAPEIVDGAVAFIGDDEVEGLDRDVRVVDDRRRLLPKRLAQLVAGAFVDLGVDLFAAQHGVKALDGGDADAADAVELRGLQVLDVVKLGELAAVVGRDELLEFFQGLVAEVAAVDEEEDAARAGELDEAVNEVDGGVGLAAAGGHLD